MAEIKSMVMHNASASLAAGANERNSEEFVAQEDMKIIGCMIGVSAFDGMDYEILVQKSGTFKELGSYTSATIPETSDYPMFDFKSTHYDPDKISAPLVKWMMLPQGEYFLIEKGERFYAHFRHHNGHSATGHYSAGTVVIFWK